MVGPVSGLRTPRDVARAYWDAECTRDLAATLAYYHDDAVVYPPDGTKLVGHAQIATFYQQEMKDYPGLEVEIVHDVTNGPEASLEWAAVLIDHDGIRHPIRGVNVVRVRDGKFEWVRAYFDPALGLRSE